ncbi:MAG: cytochrome c3 family protein [Bacteroidota bacterium]
MKRYFFLIGLAVAGIIAISPAKKEPLGNSSLEVMQAKQSLKFSHTLHVKDQGVGCEDCHTTVRTSKQSADKLTPGHEVCKTCHDEQVSKNCAYCHLHPDNIIPLVHPEREGLFSHEKHLAQDSMKCDVCHAGIDTTAQITSANMPGMPTCTNCHTDKKVAITCETCHRNFTSLVPSNHLEGNFKKDHKELTRIGMLNVACNTCHSENFCQDCHSGIELQGFYGNRGLMADPSPRGSTKDSPKQLRLQQVHSLNYKYTHSIDAKSKALDCSACHDEQTFCSTCHDAGSDITQLKIKPLSHKQAGFTTLGRGSGGGLHADLARKDIESCAACHDVQGTDPVCMLCHSENGGIR